MELKLAACHAGKVFPLNFCAVFSEFQDSNPTCAVKQQAGCFKPCSAKGVPSQPAFAHNHAPGGCRCCGFSVESTCFYLCDLAQVHTKTLFLLLFLVYPGN